jgi:broad specificity phosphatase PhoE
MQSYFIHGTGAGSFIQFIDRIENCLSLIETSKAQNIYIFTHGYVLRIIWQIFLGINFLQITNGCTIFTTICTSLGYQTPASIKQFF